LNLSAAVQPPALSTRKGSYVSRIWSGRPALRWALVVGTGTAAAGIGVIFGLPLLARGFVWGLRLALDGVLWLAVAITTGTDVWTIAGTAGRALASSLVTPQAIGGTGGLLVLGALAVVGLRRLFDGTVREKESTK
jgi:hypothetical protein